MQTLEDILRERVGGDSRAATAVIQTRRSAEDRGAPDAVRIVLGAVGGLGKIVLGIEGNDVKVLYPSQEQIDRAAEAAEGGEGDATNVRRIPDVAAGEYVDDRDPLKPGENPLDAPARIEADGLSPRQPETVSTTAGIASTMPVDTGVQGDSAPAGASEIKNPQDGADGVGSGDGDGNKPEAINPKDHSLDDLKAIAKKEGAELKASDNTKAEIAAAINRKRGAAAE